MLKNNAVNRGLSWYKQAGTTPVECWYICGSPSQPIGLKGTVAPATGTLFAIPFMTGRGGTIDRIAFEVTTVSAAGGKARVGIYSSTDTYGNPYPNKLIIDGGEFAVDAATGVKSTTISQALPEGVLLWAVYLCGTAAPTVRGILGQACYGLLGQPSTIGTTIYTELSVAQAYGALPSTFPAGAALTSATIPLIAIRYSA